MVPFDQPEYERWFGAAEQTLQDGETFAGLGLHHWAAFAAQQAGEAALKALLRGLGKPVVTHSLKQLFDQLASLGLSPDEALRHTGRVLERHYKGTRYPDEYPAGTPRDHYDGQISREALDSARTIVEFVRGRRSTL